MHKIRIQLKSFSAAHRLRNYHADKCSNLHGHNYNISVTLGTKQLNEFGFVMDFRRVKELCNDWIEKYWDHAVILNENDSALLGFLKREQQKFFLLPNECPTSVENLAKYAFTQLTKIIEQANKQIKLLQVEISETENCTAIYAK
jgi:6-pyruvoyltetrahydropterin/6-carboxytetrahydropterin synthase